MESWSDALLPPPENTYPYSDDSGVNRTPFDVGIREQSQKWTDGWRTYTAEVALLASEIRPAEVFLAENGYSWFLFPLISDATPESPPDLCLQEQEVRMTAPPQYTMAAADRVMLQLTLEVKPLPATASSGGGTTYASTETSETVATRITAAESRKIELRNTGWTEAGLPLPQNTYTYEDDAGVARTPVEVGIKEQERRYPEEGWRFFHVTFWLTAEELKTAEEYIAAVGYREFRLPLIANYPMQDRCYPGVPVRIVSQPTYRTKAADLFELNVDLGTRYSMGYVPKMRVSQFQVMFGGSLPTRASQFMVQFAGVLPTHTSQFMVQYAGRFGLLASQFMVQGAGGGFPTLVSQFMVQGGGALPLRMSQFMVQGAEYRDPY